MANLGSNFYPKLVQMTSELGMKPEDLVAIMVSESGISPSAGKGNAAAGLVQFMPDTLHGVGFSGTQNDFRMLSGEDQLPYIKKLIENSMRYNGGPFTSAAQYYVANFYPVALKLPGIRRGDPSTAFVEEDPETVSVDGHSYSKKYFDIGVRIDPQSESAAYKANPLFHGKTPGVITYGDMINQVNKNKQSPLYRQALLAMNSSTGYQPSSKQEPAMLALKDQDEDVVRKYLNKMKGKGLDVLKELSEKYHSSKSAPTASTDILPTLTRYLQQVRASEKTNKKLYKKYLPNNYVTIQVESKNYTDTIEFSRILCMALDEELMAKAFIHTDNNKTEIECSILGPEIDCFETIKQLTNSIADAFKSATVKIGGIDIKTKFIMNKKSSYQPITFKLAHTQYRKFLLKFI